jgi:nicotinamidase-related amidase
MLQRNEAVLVFIDVQGRLAEIMHNKETLDGNLARMIECAKLLELPIVGTEQIPEKLGATNEPFKTLLDGVPLMGKTTFSCCGDPAFLETFQSLGKRQAILVGIETHVCVYQTAIDLLEEGIEVFVIADAVSSRTPENKGLALDAMRDAGAKIIPTESAMFALLRDAADPRFKELLKLIK